MDQDPSPSSDNDSPPQTTEPAGLEKFWAELKRRKVMRVTIAYMAVAWFIIQVAEVLLGGFGAPEWVFRFVVLLLCVLFPVAILLAWVFELTPEGIKATKAAEAESEKVPVSKKQKRKNFLFNILYAVVLLVSIGGAVTLFFYVRSSGGEQADLSDMSIAVLPLENLSPNPDNAFFADGVQEDILTNLSKVEELTVISRTSTLGYKNTTKKSKQIGEELNVRNLVEGSVRRAGDQVRVSAQLIDTQTDDHVWAENYDRRLDDIFAIQAEVAQEIATQLHAALSPEEIENIKYRPTQNQEAYDSYVKFRNLLATGTGTRDEKFELLEKAVEHDPEFAEAWASMAIEFIYFWDTENRQDSKLYDKAHHALEQARRMGPDLALVPFALSSFALREHHDPAASISYLLQVLSIDPGFQSVHWRLEMRYLLLGRLAEAQHHLETAVRLDPLRYNTNWDLVRVYERRELWNEALALIQKNSSLSQDERWGLVQCKTRYLQSGDKEDFGRSIESLPSYYNNHLYKLHCKLLSRDYSNALVHLEHIGAHRGLRFISWFDFGISHLRLLSSLILFEQGDLEKSVTEVAAVRKHFEEITEKSVMPFPANWSELAICYALEGKVDQMEHAMAKAREISESPYHQYYRQAQSEVHIAMAYLTTGDHEKAIDTLEIANGMESHMFLNRELDLWFIFDRLRGNPRFDALLED